MAKRNLWVREDIQRALVLYLGTPFGQIHSGNPRIIELAQQINRTPSAVALKMSNLAGIDDSLDRKGMANTAYAGTFSAITGFSRNAPPTVLC